MTTVYLCGFMGCGKSHIGRMLSSELGRKLLDLDRYIVENEGMSIPEIFSKYGEPHFREMEADYIRKLSGGYIVATGGGALINDNTAEFARQSGFSVYINASFSTCYERIKNDSNRPLVVNNTVEELKKIYNTRSEIYRRNSMAMVNGNARDSIICGEIIKLINYFEKNGSL